MATEDENCEVRPAVPRNPIQPVVRDKHGVLRFKSNILVAALLEHGQKHGFGLNELAGKYFEREHIDDWLQLCQLIGYSVSGAGDLSYMDDGTYSAVLTMIDEGLTEKDARIASLEHELFMLKSALREPIARLYGIHLDDLKGRT